MALQGPFFGKREEPTAPRTPGSSTLGGTSSLGSASSSAQPFSAPAATPAPATPAAPESGATLTVGPNIKLKGVEITDCDTLVVEGTVEATMDSRVIQITADGAFRGSAEIDIAEIHGEFEGNLTVREKLVIFGSGRVHGKIRYGKVIIEEGGQLTGEIECSGSTRKPAASTSSTAKTEKAAESVAG